MNKVCLRIRPFTKAEKEAHTTSLIEGITKEDNLVVVRGGGVKGGDEAKFTFSHVAGPEVSQEELFRYI